VRADAPPGGARKITRLTPLGQRVQLGAGREGFRASTRSARTRIGREQDRAFHRSC
jgi:hypothetical protein